VQGPGELSAVSVSPGDAGTGVYRLVALGDSLTAGNGDTRAGGYAGRLQKLLEGRGWRTSLVNLAVPGAESGEVLARLSEPEVRAAVAAASLLLVSAGGNDLSHTLRPVSGRALADPEPAREAARANLVALVRELRRVNPTAAIRLIGIYNPFEVAPSEEPAARALLASWNAVLEAAADTDSGAVLVPTADLFHGHPERLASDAYHPGPEGHALIADRIQQTLPSAHPSGRSPGQ
jgi:lysophospholipase L1-like esterase